MCGCGFAAGRAGRKEVRLMMRLRVTRAALGEERFVTPSYGVSMTVRFGLNLFWLCENGSTTGFSGRFRY